MMKFQLPNGAVAKIAIEVMTGELPARDDKDVENMPLSRLSLYSLYSRYEGAVSSFLPLMNAGLYDLIVCVQDVATNDFYPGLLSVEAICEAYDMRYGTVRRNIEHAIDVARIYGPYNTLGGCKADNVLFRVIAKYAKEAYADGSHGDYSSLVVDRVGKYVSADSIQTTSDMACYLFLLEYIVERVEGHTTTPPMKYIKDYPCRFVTRNRMIKFLHKQKLYYYGDFRSLDIKSNYPTVSAFINGIVDVTKDEVSYLKNTRFA